jgi:hypothetical protein
MNTDDDDYDDVIASVDHDDIGEAKYSSINKNKASASQNNQISNLNFGNSNSGDFNNLANTFSHQNNKATANNKSNNTNIWDFDFGAASSSSDSNIKNNNDKKTNMDYSDFQFFDNNSNSNNKSNNSNNPAKSKFDYSLFKIENISFF